MAEIHRDQRLLLQAAGLAVTKGHGTALLARPFGLLAAISLAAAAVAGMIRAATPFDHGIWLVAYLFLVGFLAQALLAAGQDSLYRRTGRPPSGRLVRMEAVLWNFGVVAVPLGVLLNARIAVVAGSCALLPALGLFARSLGISPNSHGAIPIAMAYMALVLAMSASVVIGTALAWDVPWI
jgi:hypothetical protein